MRRIGSIALAMVLAIGLGGCVWLLPRPPAELVDAASAYAMQVESLDGVVTATADVDAVDTKDRPGEWIVHLRVEAGAAERLATVPDAVRDIRPPSGADTAITITFPGATGIAPVTLSDLGSAGQDRAQLLRTLPFVVTVSVEHPWSNVTMSAGTRLTDAAETLRESGVYALTSTPVRLSYDMHKGSVEVSIDGPSTPLLDLLQELQERPSTTSVIARESSAQSQRPNVSVSTDNAIEVAASLASLEGDEHDGRPRTSFTVQGAGEPIRGFVGLPLGSPEPNDLARQSSEPRDPTAQLDEYTEAITTFLDDTAVASGIPGTPELYVAPCSGAEGVSQVEGVLLLDVFAHADSGDPTYNAVTTFWEERGYAHSDQALGTAIYSPSIAEPIELATIRGTSDGIRIRVVSACVV